MTTQALGLLIRRIIPGVVIEFLLLPDHLLLSDLFLQEGLLLLYQFLFLQEYLLLYRISASSGISAVYNRFGFVSNNKRSTLEFIRRVISSTCEHIPYYTNSTSPFETQKAQCMTQFNAPLKTIGLSKHKLQANFILMSVKAMIESPVYRCG